MSYQIEIKNVPAQPILGIREATQQAEIATALGRILPAVFGYAQQNGAQIVGPPIAIYHGWNPPSVELEGAVPIAQAIAGSGEIVAGELPAGDVAATVHMGHYDTLINAYNALQEWMKQNSKHPAGAPWEIYWTDPSSVSDPAHWKTEILWPVK